VRTVVLDFTRDVLVGWSRRCRSVPVAFHVHFVASYDSFVLTRAHLRRKLVGPEAGADLIWPTMTAILPDLPYTRNRSCLHLMHRPVRAIVVDDESPARELLTCLLKAETDVEVVGQAAGIQAAIELIRDERPDLIFLDIEMPGGGGFSLLRAIAPNIPAVVFVTAYDAHAIEAFEVAAVDYLLKPVVETRLRVAVRRAVTLIRNVRADEIATRVTSALDRVGPAAIEQLPMWVEGRVLFLKTRDIAWIDADGDFVRAHLGTTEYSTRSTMADFEARLPPTFVRVHRSYIVNRQHIREIQPWVKGDYVIILADGKRITTGRTYRDRVRALLPPETSTRN